MGTQGPEPPGLLGPFPKALARAYAPSLRFKQGTFICPGIQQIACNIAYLSVVVVSFFGVEKGYFLISFPVGCTFPQRLRTILPHQDLKTLTLVRGRTFQIVVFSYMEPQGSWLQERKHTRTHTHTHPLEMPL